MSLGMKVVRRLAFVVVGFVVLALGVDAVVGIVQPTLEPGFDTPEAEARMRDLLKQRTGTIGFHLIRTALLLADVKPVRLDPRGEVPAEEMPVP